MYVNLPVFNTVFVKQESDGEEEAYEMIQEPFENEAAPDLDQEYTYQDILRPQQPHQYSPSFNELQNETPQNAKLSISHSQKQSIPESIKEDGSQNPTLISFPGVANNSHYGTRTNLRSSVVGTEVLNSDEFVKQLSQKVRKQAERMVQLETYRELCEERLREIAPGHPLPVLEAHLGSDIRLPSDRQLTNQMAEYAAIIKKKDEEISNLQQEISSHQNSKRNSSFSQEFQSTPFKRDEFLPQSEDISVNYTILYGKYRALLKDKEQLELSLRNETFSNEEQRAYAEVLKQLLEEKFNLHGIPSFLSDGTSSFSSIDLFYELKRALHRAETANQEAILSTGKLQEREAELQNLSHEYEKIIRRINDLTQENLQLSESNIKLTQLVSDYEAECKKIEAEKYNLIDYIDKHKLDEQQVSPASDLEDQVRALKEENEALRAENEELWSVENDGNEQKNGYRASKFSEQLVSKNREIELLHARIEGLTEEINKLNGELKNYKTEQQIPKVSSRDSKSDEKNHLLERIDKLNSQEGDLRKTINQVSQKLTDSQNQVQFYQQQQKNLHNEISELKEIIKNQKFGISETQNYSTVSKEHFDSGERALSNGKDKAPSTLQQQQMHENANEKSELLLIIQEQKSEIDSYENLLNDTKARAEKDRLERREEFKRLIVQNQEFKTELYKLREDFENSQQELQLKTEELKLMKEHLDKRAAQNRALTEENRNLRIKADEYEVMGRRLEQTRGGTVKTTREDEEFESSLFDKNEDNRLLKQKLESTEFQLLNTMKSFRQLEQDKDDVKAENRRLLEKTDDLEREVKNLKRFKQDKDLETFAGENKVLHQPSKEIQEDRAKVVESANEKLNTAIKAVKENFGALFQLVESSNGQTALLSKRIKEVMARLSNYHYKAADEQVLLNLAELVHEVALSLSQELDTTVRRGIDLKQELAVVNQRAYTLDKKCMELTNAEYNTKAREEALRYELETLKEEKINQVIDPENPRHRTVGDRKALLEQENEELRAEIERLIYQIGMLKATRNLAIEIAPEEQLSQQPEYKKTLSTEDSPRRETNLSNAVEIKLLEERCAVLNKEKKSVEEILQSVIDLIPNPDIRKLIVDILKLQTDIDIAERESQKIESRLTDLEADFKILIKRTLSGSPGKSQGLRSDIEILRNQLNNITSQKSILKKRKVLLLDELKSFEILEKRRFETHIETEKALLLAKRDIQEIKLQNNSLQSMNRDYKDAFNTVSQERKVLDYENIRLKYAASLKDKEPGAMANFQTFAGSDGFLKKAVPPEINTDDYQGTASDYFAYDQGGSRSARRLETPNYQRFRQSEFFAENGSKSVRGGSGNNQMKLKDRLSQAKDAVYSVKKTLENEYSRPSSNSKPSNNSNLSKYE